MFPAERGWGSPGVFGDGSVDSVSRLESLLRETRTEPPSGSGLGLMGLDGTAGLLQRHSEWERKMDTTDKRHYELSRHQFNLVKEQVGSLAQEVSLCRRDVDSLRLAIQELAPRLVDGREMLLEERRAREASHAAALGRVELAERELRRELSALSALCRERLAEASELSARSSEASARAERGLAGVRAEVDGLRREADRIPAALRAGDDAVGEAAEREAAALRSSISALEERAAASERTLATQEAQQQALDAGLGREGVERRETEALLAARLTEAQELLQRGLEQERAERRGLRALLEEQELSHARSLEQLQALRADLETHTHASTFDCIAMPVTVAQEPAGSPGSVLLSQTPPAAARPVLVSTPTPSTTVFSSPNTGATLASQMPASLVNSWSG